MTDTRLMYGATESATGALMPPPVPTSVSQSVAPFVAECVGTFALVFTAGCCLLSPGDPAWNATAIGSVFMVMVYATGPVSGGNLNPAVSFALGLVGNLSWPTVFGYWVAQLAGGIGAGFSFCALFNPRKVRVEPGPPYTWQYAAAAEALYTCTLCFVVLNCVVSRRNNPREDTNQFYGLAIGFVIIAGGYSAGGISGACFNPALAMGLDASGAAAAALFRLVRPEEFGPEEELVAYEPRLLPRCLSEFLGVFILVLTVGLNLSMASAAMAWSAAGALMCMTYSLGTVSGAHFNPAVTLAVVLRGRCSVVDGLAYGASQLLAGAAAGAACGAFHAAGPNAEKTYGLGPGMGYSLTAAGAVELVFTFVLAYVVLSCSTVAPPASWRTKQSAYSGLAIAACMAAGGIAGGAVSGGELNPAVCFGIATASLYHHGPGAAPPSPLAACLALSTWELAGGLLAAVVFRRTHPGEFRSMPLLSK